MIYVAKIGSNFVISPSESAPVVVYRSNAGRTIQVNTAVVGTRGVPLPVHNIIVAVEQTIPDLQKKWTRFGDKRRVYANTIGLFKFCIILVVQQDGMHRLMIKMSSFTV